MEAFAEKFTGNVFNEVGPLLLTKTVREMCNISEEGTVLDIRGIVSPSYFKVSPLTRISKTDPSKCYNTTVVGPDTFYPVRYFEAKAGALWPKKPVSDSHWENRFNIGGSNNVTTAAVHFFYFATKDKAVSGDPARDAYSFLGPRYCPKSYLSGTFIDRTRQ